MDTCRKKSDPDARDVPGFPDSTVVHIMGMHYRTEENYVCPHFTSICIWYIFRSTFIVAIVA